MHNHKKVFTFTSLYGNIIYVMGFLNRERKRTLKMNIKELARRAGVSSATVSRVLNNSGYVKEETRKKVLEAVEEYNYVPNALARNLSIKDNPSI